MPIPFLAAYAAGAAGVVSWDCPGAFAAHFVGACPLNASKDVMVECRTNATRLLIRTEMGPMVKEMLSGVAACSKANCSGRGRCSLLPWADAGYYPPQKELCVCDAGRAGTHCESQLNQSQLKTDDDSDNGNVATLMQKAARFELPPSQQRLPPDPRLSFGRPVLISDGQVNTSNQMAHGCDRFFNMDAAGSVIFGSGQSRIFFSTDGARTFQAGYAQGPGFPSVGSRGELLHAGPLSKRDFGEIYTRTESNTTSYNFSSEVYTNYSLVAGNITAKVERVPAGKNLSFAGLPHGIRCESFACSLRLQGTSHVTLRDKSELQTAIVWWGGNSKYRQATSIVVFHSTDGWSWNFRGIVANASQYPTSQEGPNEHSATLLADGHTVMVLMRMDGGDGLTHPFKAFSRTVSTDLGRTWSLAQSVAGLGCARPRLHMMGQHGPLLASGGRGKPGLTEGTPGYPNDVKLWVSADGMGEQWETHSLSFLHNSLMPAGTAPELLFDNSVNHTSSMSRRETTAYTALLPAGSDNEAVVIYGLLRYWTAECNRSSGVMTHCFNRSVHGSEIRANYGFAMRIMTPLLAPSLLLQAAAVAGH